MYCYIFIYYFRRVVLENRQEGLNVCWRPCFIRNTRDDWAEIEARLKKPSYDELKKKKSGSDGGTAAGGQHFVKDLEGDGGIGAFSKLHHEMEQAILQGEDKLWRHAHNSTFCAQKILNTH